jgi:hypothetical protein
MFGTAQDSLTDEEVQAGLITYKALEYYGKGYKWRRGLGVQHWDEEDLAHLFCALKRAKEEKPTPLTDSEINAVKVCSDWKASIGKEQTACYGLPCHRWDPNILEGMLRTAKYAPFLEYSSAYTSAAPHREISNPSPSRRIMASVTPADNYGNDNCYAGAITPGVPRRQNDPFQTPREEGDSTTVFRATPPRDISQPSRWTGTAADTSKRGDKEEYIENIGQCTTSLPYQHCDSEPRNVTFSPYVRYS